MKGNDLYKSPCGKVMSQASNQLHDFGVPYFNVALSRMNVGDLFKISDNGEAFYEHGISVIKKDDEKFLLTFGTVYPNELYKPSGVFDIPRKKKLLLLSGAELASGPEDVDYPNWIILVGKTPKRCYDHEKYAAIYDLNRIFLEKIKNDSKNSVLIASDGVEIAELGGYDKSSGTFRNFHQSYITSHFRAKEIIANREEDILNAKLFERVLEAVGVEVV